MVDINKTMSVLQINDLRIWAYHGWYEEERLIGGEYRIDVVMNLVHTPLENELDSTVDYQLVVDAIRAEMSHEHKLIESACKSIFVRLSQLPIEALEVTITKLDLPINNLKSTSFTLRSA